MSASCGGDTSLPTPDFLFLGDAFNIETTFVKPGTGISIEVQPEKNKKYTI